MNQLRVLHCECHKPHIDYVFIWIPTTVDQRLMPRFLLERYNSPDVDRVASMMAKV